MVARIPRQRGSCIISTLILLFDSNGRPPGLRMVPLRRRTNAWKKKEKRGYIMLARGRHTTDPDGNGLNTPGPDALKYFCIYRGQPRDPSVPTLRYNVCDPLF